MADKKLYNKVLDLLCKSAEALLRKTLIVLKLVND